MDEPLELRGAAYVMHDTGRPAPIWTLLNELRSDLAVRPDPAPSPVAKV